jgi:hypothetical protein
VGRESRITVEVQKHDPKLYCAKNTEGTLCVFRRSVRFEAYDVGDELMIYTRPAPHFVFALTNTWKTNGKPVDWGLEPIAARLKAIDLWNRPTLVDDLIESYEKDDKAMERELDNSIESFLLDFRKQFARTFDDVNTGSMNKKLDKRSSKNGSY